MDPTLILYALIAGGLVFWLRSILGTRHGDERDRPNPFVAPVPEKPRADPVTDPAFKEDGSGVPLVGIRSSLPRNVTVASDEVERGLAEIARSDRDFDVVKFSQNAQDAFVMIVEAFAKGDREFLEEMLEPSVYDGFDKVIRDRNEKGEQFATEIHAVRKAEIMAARVDAKTAYITVRFIADETCVIKNREGAILSGDPDRITEMNDIWTFSKPLKSREPIWLLHETRDGDVNEDHKTPVPGTI